MPLISRSDCEVNVHDGTFFIVDVSLSWDPCDPSDRRRLSLSAEDELVSLTLEVWDDEPGDQRQAWADVYTCVFHSETGEVCAAELVHGRVRRLPAPRRAGAAVERTGVHAGR
ncbi:hypothetical protein B1L11_39150 [Microbispora sp. GKU 823]|nr:hypothetical protein B1L11_39150 [Microbispora sp. GKU 823]